MDEEKLRQIARTQGFDENAFVRENKRLVSELGYSEQRALAEACRLFERGAYAEEKPAKSTTPADFMPKARQVSTSPEVSPPELGERREEAGKTAESLTPPAVNSELAAWLEARGFAKSARSFWKQDKVGEDTVKIQVDFSDSHRGTRYGYRLVIDQDGNPSWKPDPALRDHSLLLEFKAFRDKLLEEKAKPVTPITEVPAGEGQALALAIEAKDDEQITKELSGEFKAEVLRQYFYEFDQAGRKVVGLSYRGVKQIARRQGHIEVRELELKETEKAWIATCRALDKARDLLVYGAAFQPKELELRGGAKVPDPFSLTKAVSKAQRNALRCLISEAIVTEAYRAWLERREEFFGDRK